MLGKQEKTKDIGKLIECSGGWNVFSLLVMLMFVITLALCGTSNTVRASTANGVKVGNAWYTILSENYGFAQYEKPASKTLKTASIPDTVKIGQKTYEVIAISDNAFKNNKKLKKVTIGRNVTTIRKNAFYGCKNLKTITIKTIDLVKSGIGANAFKGLNEKAVITVPSEKLDAYKELLKNRGFTGKKKKVEGKNMEEKDSEKNDDKENTEECTKTNFLEESSFFISGKTADYTDTSCYSIGDTIKYTSDVVMNTSLYGKWRSKTVPKGAYVQCGACGKYFQINHLYGLHSLMDLEGCPGGFNFFFGEYDDPFEVWEFIPDPSPCSVEYRFKIPEGLSYKEGSIGIRTGRNSTYPEASKDLYGVEFSGNELIVTINDIKQPPFHYPFDYESYEKNPFAYKKVDHEGIRASLVIFFDMELNNKASLDNTVSSVFNYNYKGTPYQANIGAATVHAASLRIGNTDEDGNAIDGAVFDLYQKKTVFPEGSNVGVRQWVKIIEGITPGEIVNGLGTGIMNGNNNYRLKQVTVPEGYREADYAEFALTIEIVSGKTTVSAEGDDGMPISVDGGIVDVNVVNVGK